MVVTPIDRLYVEGGNRLTANNIRKQIIKANADNCSYLENTFKKLRASLEDNNLDSIMYILTEELFYEVIHTDLVVNLHNSYIKTIDKDSFINSLIDSYKIRGYKSAVFAWMPLLLR